MIPLQLRVRNFMCYRDNVPPLDFSGIHLACLSGANGHGKSALLDAMTWAVWGRARAKRDDELIHQGQAEMEVEFTFELGGQVYRVLRKRDSTGRGRTVLDLQTEHNGTFRSVAESSVRDTQAAIIRLLRMDYDTFTTSAFLLQGKADAFTSRTPAERKQVLGEILGLSQWDSYEERAKERSREAERSISQVDGALREIDAELANEPNYQAEVARAQAEVARLSAAVKEAEAALQALRQEQQRLEHQKSRLGDLERRLTEYDHDLDDVARQIEECEARLRLFDETLARRAEIEQGHAEWLAARQAEAGWNERLAQVVRLQEEQHAVERSIDAARHELELDAGKLRERERELERRARELPTHERNLKTVRDKLAALVRQQEERTAAQEQSQALGVKSAGLQAQNEQLRSAIDGLNEKKQWLLRDTGEAQCPVCGQALTDSHRDELLAQFQAEGQTQADTFRANAATIAAANGEIKRLQARITELDRDLTGLALQQRNEAQLEQALSQAQQAAEALAGVFGELAAVEGRLAAGDYAHDDRAGLARLAAELESVGYDAAAHQQARQRVQELAAFEADFQRLSTAAERRAQEHTSLQQMLSRQERWQRAAGQDRAQRDALAVEVARLPEVSRAAAGRAGEVEELTVESSRARQKLGAAQQRLDTCRSLAVERQRRAAERQRLAEAKGVYDELRLAFSKKGIQAMIIESVIPEIEAEANRLLARMTDGRMHIRFETQRETLAGDTVETLDIKIADELGTRDYALFSGGEAFRVNFAIRIALSKLLARRAGAQLQLLVVDEGFGTQDAEGRERVVEAITSVQDDFARILVITHIEELKDLFPVQIQVTKTADGCTARIQ